MCQRACSLGGWVVIRSPTQVEVVNFRSIETEVCRLLATIAQAVLWNLRATLPPISTKTEPARLLCFVLILFCRSNMVRSRAIEGENWHSARYAIQMVRIAADSMTTVFVKLTSLSANRYRTRILPIKRNCSRCAKPPFRIRGIAIDASARKFRIESLETRLILVSEFQNS